MSSDGAAAARRKARIRGRPPEHSPAAAPARCVPVRLSPSARERLPANNNSSYQVRIGRVRLQATVLDRPPEGEVIEVLEAVRLQPE